MSPTSIMIVMAIAVLIFGKRLPEVARSVGKGLAELRQGVQGIQDTIKDQITGAVTSSPSQPASSTVYHDSGDDNEESTAPKFEPPPRAARGPSEPVGQPTTTP
jgi:sec-independent protein translocase protein TatA